ncbi:hypothetical protein GQ42DRAFT_162734, partial [Ramicandelaber brevisporus]
TQVNREEEEDEYGRVEDYVVELREIIDGDKTITKVNREKEEEEQQEAEAEESEAEDVRTG